VSAVHGVPVHVLIIAPRDDLHARAVFAALKAQDAVVDWIDFAELGTGLGITLLLEAEARACFRLASGRVLELADMDTIWWRRAGRPPVDPLLDKDSGEFARSEWEHLLESLELFTATRWVNLPSANRLASRKGHQLLAARAEGLRVPRTALTNDPVTVRILARENAPLIYKRIGAAPRPLTATKALRAEDFDRLDALPGCPAIFQERIEAQLDIRATIIGTEVATVEIDSQAGGSPLDWRFDHSVPFRPHALDPTTERSLLALMRRLGLSYAAVDLRLTPAGEYVFLEVNPSGQYLFVELLTHLPLSERMASFLNTPQRASLVAPTSIL
jgi:hypothetical protein